MSEQLKPCFCGGSPEIKSRVVTPGTTRNWVMCPRCLRSTKEFITEAEAAHRWNEEMEANGYPTADCLTPWEVGRAAQGFSTPDREDHLATCAPCQALVRAIQHAEVEQVLRTATEPICCDSPTPVECAAGPWHLWPQEEPTGKGPFLCQDADGILDIFWTHDPRLWRSKRLVAWAEIRHYREVEG